MKIQLFLTIALIFSGFYINFYKGQYGKKFLPYDLKYKQTYELFEEWLQSGKPAKTISQDEMQYRFQIFQQNLEFIQDFNSNQAGDLRLGITKFFAMTNEEFKQVYFNKENETLITQNRQILNQHQEQNLQEQEEKYIQDDKDQIYKLDWNKEGAVTAVENQGDCGASWAFAVKSQIESLYYIQNDGEIELTPLSAQQMIDCILPKKVACKGAPVHLAFFYTKQAGLQSAASYPYNSGNGQAQSCQYDEEKVVFKPSTYSHLFMGTDPEAIRKQVSKYPVVALVEASNKIFQFYKSGVISSDFCGYELDHAVVITGFDFKKSSYSVGSPYWIVKNSWGPDWGENGFARILVSYNSPGVCGINQYTGYIRK